MEGQLITIEKEAKKITEDGLITHIIHELVHLNQLQRIGSLETYLDIYNKKKSLLAIVIREGIAEFFAEMVTGRYTQQTAYFYAREHEQRLWQKFKQEMANKDVGDWMWSRPQDPAQLRDVGYILGAFIAESYFKNAACIEKAILDILGTTDPAEFLRTSRYASKFR